MLIQYSYLLCHRTVLLAATHAQHCTSGSHQWVTTTTTATANTLITSVITHTAASALLQHQLLSLLLLLHVRCTLLLLQLLQGTRHPAAAAALLAQHKR
jgi:hypothetical protein